MASLSTITAALEAGRQALLKQALSEDGDLQVELMLQAELLQGEKVHLAERFAGEAAAAKQAVKAGKAAQKQMVKTAKAKAAADLKTAKAKAAAVLKRQGHRKRRTAAKKTADNVKQANRAAERRKEERQLKVAKQLSELAAVQQLG